MAEDYEDNEFRVESNNEGNDQEEDWSMENESKDSPIDDNLWLHEDLSTIADDKSDITNISSDKWFESDDNQNDIATEDGLCQHNNMTGSAISFKGYGSCDCGCGSFGGHGNICTYCGHPYSAHSRYKK